MLLAADGHVKLADFGMCKEGLHDGKRTTTFCGTPDYIAPEIIEGESYGPSVDWWALGVLLYEMIVGQPPFDGQDEDDLFESILYDEIRFPAWMPEQARAAVLGFLTRAVGRRLGVTKPPRSGDDVLVHPFFASVDWDKIEHKALTPPFLPRVKGDPRDASNFSADFTREVPQLTPIPSDQLKLINQDDFEGFSFVNEELLKKK